MHIHILGNICDNGWHNRWCPWYDGLARSSPFQIHPYFSYFSTLQSRLRLSAVNSNKHSLSLKPHPSINLGMRILKSPILGNSEFAKYNACQIFPLYGIQEMDFMNVPLSMVHLWCACVPCSLNPFSRNGGIEGGGWVHPKGADSLAVSGLSLRNALVGSGWATAVLLCMNWLRKQSSRPAQHPFSVGKPFSWSGWAVASWVLWLLQTH